VVGPINEAHNGYLGVYLNLGLIGLTLLVGFLIASYRTICKQIASSSARASLGLALWTIVLFYNMTEAATGGLIWNAFLLAAIPILERVEDPVRSVAAVNNAVVTKRFPGSPLGAASQPR
jgi:O-antigen ligase